MRRIGIEGLESRNVPSLTVAFWDVHEPAPFNIVGIVETEAPSHKLLDVGADLYGEGAPLGARIIGRDGSIDFDLRKEWNVNGIDGPIPFIQYDAGSNSWRDSSEADPLKVYLETPVQGISRAQQEQALDEVLAMFNGVANASLYLERTDVLADAQIIIGAFTQPASRSLFEIAHAEEPTSNDFDGVLRIEINTLASFQVFDSAFPVRHSWQWDYGGLVEWYKGPVDGLYGFKQVVGHELTHSLGMSHQNTLLPTITDPFYDPEWYAELSWMDRMDLADLY